MDLGKLQAVLVIAEIGSLRQAAERLHCSQPALSQMLKSVEQELGVELFERRPSGLQLLATANPILGEIRRLVDQGGRLEQVARDVAAGVIDRLDLMAVQSACETLVPSVLALWSKTWPDIRLALQSASPSQQVQALVAQDCDAALVRLPLEVPGLTTWPILTEDLIVVAPQEWDENTVTALLERPMIRFPITHGPGLVDRLDVMLADRGWSPTTVIEVADMTSLLAQVAGGCGWAVVPASLQQRHPCRIKALAIPCPDATVELALAVRSEDDRPAIANLLETCRQAAVAYRSHWRNEVEQGRLG